MNCCFSWIDYLGALNFIAIGKISFSSFRYGLNQSFFLESGE